MNGSCIYSDVVLPAATWYEKHDLSSTDLHPFVHPFNPAVPPPWEAKTDWDAFRTIAERVLASWPRPHLGTRTDLVAAPLLHDTPDEIAQPLGEVRDWRAGECEPIPGKTMPKLIVVERDYAAVAEKMGGARAAGRGARHGRKGAQLEARRGGRGAAAPQRHACGGGRRRRPALAGARRSGLRDDPRALGDHQRPPRGRELPRRWRSRPASTLADLAGTSAPTTGSRFARRRHPAAQGDRLGRSGRGSSRASAATRRSPPTSSARSPGAR